MTRLLPALLELGPLAIFWILLWTVDLKIAIGVGVVLLLADAAFRYWRGMPLTKLYILSGGMIQGLVEQQHGDVFQDGPDIRLFFKCFTLLWAVYFVLKAAVYLWLGAILPIEQALTVRPIVGMVSLGAMMLASWKAQVLFDFGVKRGWLPKVLDEC